MKPKAKTNPIGFSNLGVISLNRIGLGDGFLRLKTEHDGGAILTVV